jgi:hypothetical protein
MQSLNFEDERDFKGLLLLKNILLCTILLMNNQYMSGR